MYAYQIKISLEDVVPQVWRRAIIPGGISFSRMAAMLNDIMGWSGTHLYALVTSSGFHVSGAPEGAEEELDDFVLEEQGMTGGGQEIDEVFCNNKDFLYIYDLGDSWEHRVEIEKREAAKEVYPRILMGEGSCPPEDCGGAAVFMELMERPSDVEQELADMYREEMEPFDLERTNEFLKAVYGGEAFSKLPEALCDGDLDILSVDPKLLPNLSESLMSYRAADLKALWKKWEMKGYSGLRKQDLADRLVDVLTDPDTMSGELCAIREESLAFFETLQENPVYAFELTREAHAQAGLFMEKGYVFLTEELIFFVPKEIKECYRRMNRAVFEEKRRRARRILDYCMAAVNLYGIVEIDKLIEIFNGQNETPLEKGELFAVLALQEDEEERCVVCGLAYLCDSAIQWDIFDAILQEQMGKPYYVPRQEAFLRYADPDYCEKPLAWKAVERFFKKEMRLKDFDAEFLCHELQMIVHVGGNPDAVFEALDEFQVPEPTERQMIQMADLLMDAWNCTRMVTNRGFTPNEMKGMESPCAKGGEIPDNIIPFPGLQKE